MKVLKRIFFIIVISFVFLVNVSFAETGKVNTSAVRLRGEANTEAKIITNIYENEEVDILSETGDWYKVKYKDNTGYVKKEFINKENSNQPNNNKNTSNPVNSNTNNSTNTNNNNNNVSNNTTSTENTLENNNTVAQNENNQVEEPNSEQDSNNIVTISEVKLRAIPSLTSATVAQLENGKGLTKTAELNNWIKVTDGSITGWILKNKVKTESTPIVESSNFENPENNTTTEEPKQENTNPTEEKTVNKTGIINVGTAIVRKSAKLSSEVINYLYQDNKVNIIAEEGDWYKVTSGNVSGYVNKKLITLVDDKVTSRGLAEEREKELEENTEQPINENADNNSVVSQAPVNTTGNGQRVSEFAKKYLNFPYVVGGKQPETGFDCSGFTRYVYSNFGYSLGSTAASQTSVGKEISRDGLNVGDLILFYDEAKTKIGHTGIYLGDGNFIHAANPTRGVVIDNLNSNSYYNERFVTARRIVE